MSKIYNILIHHNHTGKVRRNNDVLDTWSLVHFASGFGMAIFMNPWLAFALHVAWEPLELFVISPIMSKVRVTFGYETFRNSIADIIIGGAGIFCGYMFLNIVLYS